VSTASVTLAPRQPLSASHRTDTISSTRFAPAREATHDQE
jgi:hypothetical protein